MKEYSRGSLAHTHGSTFPVASNLLVVPIQPKAGLKQDAVIRLFHLVKRLFSTVGRVTLAAIAIAAVNRPHSSVPNLQKEASMHRLVLCRQLVMNMMVIRRVDEKCSMRIEQRKINTSCTRIYFSVSVFMPVIQREKKRLTSIARKAHYESKFRKS